MIASARTVRRAWLGLTIALAVHVADEATHDFLSVYNPTVKRVREVAPFLPLPTFTFQLWLAGLLAAVVLLGAFGWQIRSVNRWVIRGGYAFATLMTANGLVHIITSVLQHRLMPGTMSAPLLLICSIYLLWVLQHERLHAHKSAAGEQHTQVG